MTRLPRPGLKLFPRIVPPLGGWAVPLACALGLGAIVLAAPHAPALAQAKARQEVVVRLAGSGTIGEKAALELAEAWSRDLRLSGLHVDGSLDPDEYEVVAEGAEINQRLRVQVQTKGTEVGLEPLLRGQTDIWMTTRPVREADLESARAHRVPGVPTLAEMRAPGVETAIGLAALAVIVNPRNPVAALSVERVRDIYSGKVTRWDEVGGPSGIAIAVYSLDTGTDETDAFCGSLMGTADTSNCVSAFPPLAAPRMRSAEDLVNAVVGNPAAIGFAGFSARRSARIVPLATACGSHIEPSVFGIQAGEYPLVQRLYFYHAPGRVISPAARGLIQFARSRSGQAAISAAGLADLTIVSAGPNYGASRLEAVRATTTGGQAGVSAAALRGFESAIAGTERLSVTFRFPGDGTGLDRQAEADLARLIAFMRQASFSQSALALIDYSGVTAEQPENRAQAHERADAIRDRLLAAGVRNVSSFGVSPDVAARCGIEPAGRAVGRIVEVWLHS